MIGHVLERTVDPVHGRRGGSTSSPLMPTVPIRIERLIDILFTVAFALQGAVWARELVLGVISRKAGEDPSETAVGNAMAVIRVLVSIAVFALAIVVILDNLGVNVTALVAGLGVGGIAIGLAAQGIFSDLFAALSILFDKPFRRGDIIHYDQTTGTVERIGLKTTRLRSVNGEQVVISNAKLLEREIHNFNAGRQPPLVASVRGGLPDCRRTSSKRCRRWSRGRSKRAKAVRSFAAPSSASAPRASTSSSCTIRAAST